MFDLQNTLVTTHITRSKINTPMFSHGKTPTGKHPRPSQCDHLEQFINAKKKITERFYKRVSHNRSSANDPPCSLNRDHGPIGC
jgi:hypothetical protein